MSPAGTFKQIAVSAFHACAIRSDNTLRCWGNNVRGQSDPPKGTFVQVAAGASHTCAIRGDGSLSCWGWNDDGQATPP